MTFRERLFLSLRSQAPATPISCEREIGKGAGYQRVEKQKPEEQYEYQDGSFVKDSLRNAHGSGSLSQQPSCACLIS